MKIYSDFRRADGSVLVTISGRGVYGMRHLPVRLDLFNHSPDGFEWGYSGSGPAQLALAILADALDNDLLAVQLHQDFKRCFIAGLARDQRWSITALAVREFARAHKQESDDVDFEQAD